MSNLLQPAVVKEIEGHSSESPAARHWRPSRATAERDGGETGALVGIHPGVTRMGARFGIVAVNDVGKWGNSARQDGTDPGRGNRFPCARDPPGPDLVAHERLRSLLYDLQAGDPLTPRETAVLAMLLEHPSHAAIAAQLNVSVNTVKSQLRSVYRKLGVKTRDEAIALALERHLLTERD